MSRDFWDHHYYFGAITGDFGSCENVLVRFPAVRRITDSHFQLPPLWTHYCIEFEAVLPVGCSLPKTESGGYLKASPFCQDNGLALLMRVVG